MIKCGKYIPCEYFSTGGCISPFNCIYKIEEPSCNTINTIATSNTQRIIDPKDKKIEDLENKLALTQNALKTFLKEVQACFYDCPYFEKCPNTDNKNETYCFSTILKIEEEKRK